MSTTTLRFTALDTLFFRESRPFDVIGGSELASVFPPPPRTVAGAIRTAIGEALGADWRSFKKACDDGSEYIVGDVDLHHLIGLGDNLGQLALEGIWLSTNGERLYPAPSFLMRKSEGNATIFNRLAIGAGAATSLGRVLLPQAPDRSHGYNSITDVWLTRAGLEEVLAGRVPDAGDIRERNQLISDEPRLGIARDNSRRTAEEGMLYQTRHIRPMQDARLAIEADVTGLDDELIDKRIVRFGGEGRMAGIEIVEPPLFPNSITPSAETHGLILIFLTPARFGERAWLPSSLKPQEQDGMRVWRGAINGISLTVHCAVVGNPQREGGWDLAISGPRPVQSLVPAGSAWYCTVDNGDLHVAIDALHGKYLGEDKGLGRGHIVCGLWNSNELVTGNGDKS